MKILVIEDSRILQTGMKYALIKAGHDVQIAVDGNEGLQLAQKNLPDLILLDMMLPMMSGVDVLAALKKENATKDIPVFVLTGLSQKNEQKILKAGAAKFLEKSDMLFAHDFRDLVRAVSDFAPSHSSR